MTANIGNVIISDDDRKTLSESAFGKKGSTTRKEVQSLARQAIVDAFQAHGVRITFKGEEPGEEE